MPVKPSGTIWLYSVLNTEGEPVICIVRVPVPAYVSTVKMFACAAASVPLPQVKVWVFAARKCSAFTVSEPPERLSVEEPPATTSLIAPM